MWVFLLFFAWWLNHVWIWFLGWRSKLEGFSTFIKFTDEDEEMWHGEQKQTCPACGNCRRWAYRVGNTMPFWLFTEKCLKWNRNHFNFRHLRKWLFGFYSSEPDSHGLARSVAGLATLSPDVASFLVTLSDGNSYLAPALGNSPFFVSWAAGESESSFTRDGRAVLGGLLKEKQK